MEKALPPIPAKRYFTIGEVSELCGVKPYVLRYWEQEFTQLKPMKRRGNRRYYQHHEVLLVRRIRELLYEQGFTISGARNRLTDVGQHKRVGAKQDEMAADAADGGNGRDGERQPADDATAATGSTDVADQAEVADVMPGDDERGLLSAQFSVARMREELLSIRSLLSL